MIEQEIPMEELKDEARTTVDRVSVAGSDLIRTIQALLREAAVRKITVQDKTGRTLLEIPLYAGVIGAFFIGSWTVVALVAAWFAEVSILIERDAAADGEPSVVGEAIERTVGAASASARTGVGSFIGGAAHAASDLAKRAADSLEGRMAHGNGHAVQQAAEMISEAAVEPRRCAALTKAGAPCKRTALPGSLYCATHQPK
jgi:hypothetical protein